MKKRILSILLAVMMVVPMLTMAIPVSAAGVSNNYSYKFEETDARNFVEGQVLDIAAQGEAAVAPEMNGELTDYQVEKVFINYGKTSDTKTAYFSIKSGYLYVAIVTNDIAYTVNEEEVSVTENNHAAIQYDIGLAQYHTSDILWSRERILWKSDDSVSNAGVLFQYPKGGAEGTLFADKGSTFTSENFQPIVATNFIVDKNLTLVDDKAIYEAKFNIAEYYKLYAGSLRGENIYDTPCMSFYFFYQLGSSGNNGHYVSVSKNCQIEAAASTPKIPATIIIPDTTLSAIRANASKIGTLGTDYRNAVDGQLKTITNYADTAPNIDGSFEGDTYSVENTFDGMSGQNVTVKMSITRDGFIYVGGTYYDVNANTKDMQIQIGLMGNYAAHTVSKVSGTIKADGTKGGEGMMIKQAPWRLATGSDGTWDTHVFGVAGRDCGGAHPYMDGALTYDEKTQIVTFEAKFALAPLIALFEDQGWDAIETNCINVLVYDGANFATFKTAADTAALKNYSYGDYTSATAYPMFELPKGAIERFTVDDVYDLEAYGQKHVNVVKNTANIDGVIADGEYSSGYDCTIPSLKEQGVSIINHFSGDDEWFYIAAKVVDPGYVSGTTKYHYDLMLNPNDDIVDISETNRRITGYVWHDLEKGTLCDKPGVTWRTQTTNGKDSKESKVVETIASIEKADFIKAATSYDEETNTVIYEIALNKAAIKACYNTDAAITYEKKFAADEKIDSFSYYCYYPSYSAWSYMTVDSSRIFPMLKAMTKADFGGTLVYNTLMTPDVVVNLIDDAATQRTASARISTENAGLRFKTVYSDAYLAEMKAYATEKGAEMKVGTLIAPYDYVADRGLFTHEALGAGNYVEVFGDVEKPYAEGAGTTTIAGSIVNIKEKNLNRDFAGIGFIQIGDEYFYSDTYAVRNIKDIATAALADTSANYTAGQREILGKLNGTVK